MRTDPLQRYWRFGTKSPIGQGEAWELLPVPGDWRSGNERAFVKNGYNLLGPTLDLSLLSFEEKRELVRLCSMYNAQLVEQKLTARRDELLERCPRTTVPGPFDIDCSDNSEETREQANNLALKLLIAWGGETGQELRISNSSGTYKPSIHMECGSVDESVSDPDILRAIGRLAFKVATSTGLIVPWSQSNWSHAAGFPLTLVHRDFKDDKAPPVKIDLSILNHSPSKKGRLFRPLGGSHKRAPHVKILNKAFIQASEDLYAPALMISKEVYDKCPAAPEQNFKKHNACKFKEYEAKLERIDVKVGRKFKRLVNIMKGWAQEGKRHGLRLALAATFIKAKILRRKDFVKIVGAALGEPQDCRDAWDSTKIRIEAGQPCKSKKYLANALGSSRIWELCKELSRLTGVPVAELRSRFGGYRLSSHHVKDLESRLTKKAPPDSKLWRRPSRAAHCGDFKATANCGFCKEELYQAVRRCHCLELCGKCLLTEIRRVESWCQFHWDVEDVAVVTWRGFESMKEAQKKVTYLIQNKHAAPLRVYYPTNDGLWSVFLIGDTSPDSRTALASLADCSATVEGKGRQARYNVVSKRRGIALLISALAQRAAAVEHLVLGERYDEAATLLQTLYRTHRVIGARRATLPFPSKQNLTDDAKAALDQQKAEESQEPCECSEHFPPDHSLEHIPTGIKILEGETYSVGMDKAINALRRSRGKFIDGRKLPPEPVVMGPEVRLIE